MSVARALPPGVTQEMADEFVGACHGDTAKIWDLISRHPELTHVTASWGETPLQAAAQMAQREIIELLLAQRAPLDICTAAVIGQIDEVESMLDADPSLRDATGAHGIPVMYFPVIGGHLDIAELLFSRGASVNGGEGVSTPLHGAAMFGRAPMARWLVEHGADLSAPDYEGKTPLQVAEERGHHDVAAALEP